MKDLDENKKIAVAMSGGVDSSVAAAMCAEKYGKENVFGLTMRLFCYGEMISSDKSCCSLEAINDARKVCDKIGIRHYVIDLEEEFKKEVIENFIAEYQNGRTPNPCIKCNELIKFDSLLQKAFELGADFLVTGHYARIDCNIKSRTCSLFKGLDKLKDQSYFLYTMNQSQLAHVLLPLGVLTKISVRKLAEKYELTVSKKKESQDICFITDGVSDFLKDKTSYKQGNIVLKDGTIVGKHSGLPFYTIGQRKGLGGGFNRPMYIISLDKEKNRITVGGEKDLLRSELIMKRISWISDIPPKLPFSCMGKVRYQNNETNCTIIDSPNGFAVKFAKPQKAITPGQSVVFYFKDEVIGGGIIEA